MRKVHCFEERVVLHLVVPELLFLMVLYLPSYPSEEGTTSKVSRNFYLNAMALTVFYVPDVLGVSHEAQVT